MWESRRNFQRAWEGWEAGLMAFHTLSFPWPLFAVQMLDKPMCRPQVQCATRGSSVLIARQ